MDRLVAILAEMLHSALAWEQEHGVPQQHSPKTEPSKPLTNIHVTYTLDGRENTDKGDGNEHQGDSEKY